MSLLSLCTWLIFFACLVYKLPPIIANDVKHVSPILHYFGIFSFALSIILANACQYFIVGMTIIETIINVSTNLAYAWIHGLCKNWWPFSLEWIPTYGRGNIWFFLNCVIKLRTLWNTTTMTQHWKISRLELFCLPTKLVHILYCCFACSLIKHSFQISSKLRYIRIK